MGAEQKSCLFAWCQKHKGVQPAACDCCAHRDMEGIRKDFSLHLNPKRVSFKNDVSGTRPGGVRYPPNTTSPYCRWFLVPCWWPRGTWGTKVCAGQEAPTDLNSQSGGGQGTAICMTGSGIHSSQASRRCQSRDSFYGRIWTFGYYGFQ